MVQSKKILSVLIVAVLMTVGVGAVFVNDEGTEGATTQTPVASLTQNARQLYEGQQNGQSTYAVGYGTYINIVNATATHMQWTVETLTSTYGDTAGLTLNTSNGYIRGSINKAVSGTVTLGMEYVNEDEEIAETFYITLTVLNVTSTQSSQYSAVNLPLNVFVEYGLSTISGVPFYVAMGSTVSLPYASYRMQGTSGDMEYIATSIPTGYGLSIANDGISGTLTRAGNITIGGTYGIAGSEENWEVEMIVIDNNPHADVRMIGGETWTYTPETNIVSVLSISGTATSWVSLSNGVVSGTAPTNTSVGQTYDLTITAETTNPSQTATQTVTFTVDPQITMIAPVDYSVNYGTDVDDILNSNFADGIRAIYSITGGTATGFSVGASDGIVEWVNPTPGTVIFTATSPYTYTSGAVNQASATMNVEVEGILSVSVSGTLYLVTGKTVPNTPSEAVTLNHSNVGSGSYTWTMVDAASSGITVSSNGTLGGTPGSVGNYTITVRCTSVVSGTTQTADATVDVVIVPVLVFLGSPSWGTIYY